MAIPHWMPTQYFYVMGEILSLSFSILLIFFSLLFLYMYLYSGFFLISGPVQPEGIPLDKSGIILVEGVS